MPNPRQSEVQIEAVPRRGRPWRVAACGALAGIMGLAVLWWLDPSLFVSTTRQAHVAGQLTPEKPKYAVAPGVYSQANAESGERLLSIDGDNRGRLVISLPTISALIVGAEKVVIDTTWEVEEDDVTFVLHGGRPQASYERLLAVALEESTRFHIRAWAEASLTLERVSDGEMFEWERIDDTPLPYSESDD